MDRGGGLRHDDLVLVEIAVIHAFNWAQTVYVVAGLLQLALVFALLGIVAWLPRESPADRTDGRSGPFDRRSARASLAQGAGGR